MAVVFDFSNYASVLADPVLVQIALAIISIILGLVVAKLVGKVFYAINRKIMLIETRSAIRSFARLLELFIFIISIIVALNFLRVDAAVVIIQSTFLLVPSLIILLLLLFLGFILITLIIDLIRTVLLKVGFGEYLEEMGISIGLVTSSFSLIKIILFLIVVSASFTYVGLSIPFIDNILIAFIYGMVFLGIVLTFYVFKEPVANFFLGIYVERNMLKPGQHLRVGPDTGEVVNVTSHGTLLKLATGYDLLIPNREIVSKKVYLKRARQDVSKLESIRQNFIQQKPYYCGPASAAMMLSFFGIETPQEEIGKLAGTKSPGGTGPNKLIDAVKKKSRSTVKGVLVDYAKIHNLKDEIKAWISDGALVIIWFHKPSIFKSHQRGGGHYVLCVGVEEDELIVIDPSKATAGVYMVDYRLVEEAMSDIDKKRGYVVFAKKGTPAFWRLSQGLVYAYPGAYKELGKSFERYLKKLIRKNATIHQILSEHVGKVMKSGQGIRPVWKPGSREK